MTGKLDWEKVSDREFYIHDNDDGHIVSHLVHLVAEDIWICRFYADNSYVKNHSTVFTDAKSPEDAQKQAMMWISDTCDEVIALYDNLRNSLPSLTE